MQTETAPTLADIEEARQRLAGVARETPVYSSETFSRIAGRDVWLKAENLQRTGAFKVRGAVNKIATLSSGERAAGVVAASAGNHGQAVALAAAETGGRAVVVMPAGSNPAKVAATRAYGAEVVTAGVTGENRETFAADLAAFGAAYGGLARDDHRRFVDAFRNGRIPGL